MKLQRFTEVSGKPQMTVECHGGLDISGGREGEVAIKIYGGEGDLEVERDGDSFGITAHSRCKIGCPRGTTLTVTNAHGSLRMRRMDGPVTIEAVKGDAVLKEVGPTTIADATGDLHVRSVQGDLKVNNVSGDLAVRGVEGALKAENVSGDLSASQLEGGAQVTALGDASLRTDFTPGCDYQITASGDVSIKFPAHANARLRVTASGDIRHKVDWAEIEEDKGSLSGQVGKGEANVNITAGGDVSLQSRSDSGAFVIGLALEDEALDLELTSMAEEIERNIQEQMTRLNAQLEAKLSNIDHEAIQRKATQAADKVRRKALRTAERARMNAERAQRRWERMGVRRPTPPGPPPPPPAPLDPVTDEERMTVLRLVQEGKITAADAAQLLEAMEG